MAEAFDPAASGVVLTLLVSLFSLDDALHGIRPPVASKSLATLFLFSESLNIDVA